MSWPPVIFSMIVAACLPLALVRGWIWWRRGGCGECKEASISDPVARMHGLCCGVTQRQRNERELHERRAELLHLSCLAMLGELSGALTHELNQPLTAILSNARAAQRLLAHNPPNINELNDILGDIVSAGLAVHRTILGTCAATPGGSDNTPPGATFHRTLPASGKGLVPPGEGPRPIPLPPAEFAAGPVERTGSMNQILGATIERLKNRPK
ncbi:MAG: hypothetical protein WCK77_02460 [Verrucomicrobiota bacterium]